MNIKLVKGIAGFVCMASALAMTYQTNPKVAEAEKNAKSLSGAKDLVITSPEKESEYGLGTYKVEGLVPKGSEVTLYLDRKEVKTFTANTEDGSYLEEVEVKESGKHMLVAEYKDGKGERILRKLEFKSSDEKILVADKGEKLSEEENTESHGDETVAGDDEAINLLPENHDEDVKIPDDPSDPNSQVNRKENGQVDDHAQSETHKADAHGEKAQADPHAKPDAHKVDPHAAKAKVDAHGKPVDPHAKPKVDAHGKPVKADPHAKPVDPHAKPKVDAHGKPVKVDPHAVKPKVDAHGKPVKADAHAAKPKVDAHGKPVKVDPHAKPKVDAHGHPVKADPHAAKLKVDAHGKPIAKANAHGKPIAKANAHGKPGAKKPAGKPAPFGISSHSNFNVVPHGVLQVGGKGKPGDKIVLMIDNKPSMKGTIKPNGRWSFPVKVATAGDRVISAQNLRTHELKSVKLKIK